MSSLFAMEVDYRIAQGRRDIVMHWMKTRTSAFAREVVLFLFCSVLFVRDNIIDTIL